MSLKILLGKFVAFFAGQIPVKGHKNIIDSFQKLIVSPKRFICTHGEQFISNQSCAVDLKILSAPERPLESSEGPPPPVTRYRQLLSHVSPIAVLGVPLVGSPQSAAKVAIAEKAS
jgi:hypothetical protein